MFSKKLMVTLALILIIKIFVFADTFNNSDNKPGWIMYNGITMGATFSNLSKHKEPQRKPGVTTYFEIINFGFGIKTRSIGIGIGTTVFERLNSGITGTLKKKNTMGTVTSFIPVYIYVPFYVSPNGNKKLFRNKYFYSYFGGSYLSNHYLNAGLRYVIGSGRSDGFPCGLDFRGGVYKNLDQDKYNSVGYYLSVGWLFYNVFTHHYR